MNAAITADSTCDISLPLFERWGVAMIPLYITLGDTAYKDGVISPAELFAYVERTGELPKTSAPAVEDYAAVFRTLTAQGREVVHIAFSSEMSASCSNALLAAELVGNVRVVDSRSLSSGTGLLVIKAAELAHSGLPAQEIEQELLAAVPRVEASFVIDTLEYLHKGGRCSSVAALGANLLHLKPCIEVSSGSMRVGRKYRGTLKKCLSQYVEDRLAGRSDIDVSRAFVTHTMQDPALVEHVLARVRQLVPFAELIETTAGGTISSHCGPGTLGVLFLRKA